MTNYKKLLLGLGMTVSGSHLAEAKEPPMIEEEQPYLMMKVPSPIFLEIEGTKDMNQNDHNVGCSVTNSGCK